MNENVGFLIEQVLFEFYVENYVVNLLEVAARFVKSFRIDILISVTLYSVACFVRLFREERKQIEYIIAQLSVENKLSLKSVHERSRFDIRKNIVYGQVHERVYDRLERAFRVIFAVSFAD